MLWMSLLKMLPNSLYILLTLVFLFWLSDGIQICARTLALLLGPAVVESYQLEVNRRRPWAH